MRSGSGTGNAALLASGGIAASGFIESPDTATVDFEEIDFAIDDNAYNGWNATVHHIGGTIVIIGSALNTDASEPLPADTTEEPSPFGWKYIDYDGHVVLATDCIPATATGRVVLPKEINGKPVTGLAYHAFYARQGITELIIPDTVTDIGEAAISHCDHLRHLILPNSVTHLAVDACSGNHSLGTLKVPGSVMSLPDYVFADCSFLTVDKIHPHRSPPVARPRHGP